jgi:hypothetical protein
MEHEVVLVDMHVKPGVPWQLCPRSTLRRMSQALEKDYGLVRGFSNFCYLRPSHVLSFITYTVKWWPDFGVGCMIWRMCKALLRCAFVCVIDPCAHFLLQVVRAGFESEFYLMKQSAGWAQMSTSSVNFFEKCYLLLCIPSKFWKCVLVEWGHAAQVCVLHLSQPSLLAVRFHISLTWDEGDIWRC